MNELTFPSPDGRFNLEIYITTMRMSHEVNCPYLTELSTDKCLFDAGGLWDAGGIKWSDDSSRVSMNTRQYDRGSKFFELVIEPDKDLATLTHDGKVVYSGAMAAVATQMKLHR